MADTPTLRRPMRFPWLSWSDDRAETLIAEQAHVAEALARHKREGLELAVRARTGAMLIVAVMVLYLTPWPESLYYVAIALLFILIGFAQRRVARVGASRAELAVLFCDLLLMTITAALPNPFAAQEFPATFQFQFEIHRYFFILLATATLAYSWRTIFSVGTWTALLWLGAVTLSWAFSQSDPAVRMALLDIFADAPIMAEFLDPTVILWDQRIQEIVVFLICAVILGITVRRFNNLLLAQAGAERERANLARYFSPNVVDQLSHNDEPLKQVRTQDIAVLFVDIVGFTAFASNRSPEEVIATLRRFHALLEAEVFRYGGTLDKYLGDGLMATFGTPVTGPEDAANALRCAHGMCAAIDRLNAARSEAGEPPLRVGIGIHFGPVVLGDIGGNRLEYAVIGNTVNIASRLEALTRQFGVRIIVSDQVLRAAQGAPRGDAPELAGFTRHDAQQIRGVDAAMTLWARP